MQLHLIHFIFFASIDQSELTVADEEMVFKIYPYPYKYEHKHDILPVLRDPYKDMIVCTLANDNTCKVTIQSTQNGTVFKWEGCKVNISNIILAIGKTHPFKLASLECRQFTGNLIDIILADGNITYPPGIACDSDDAACIGDDIDPVCYDPDKPKYCLVKQNKSGEKPVVHKCVDFPEAHECPRWTWKEQNQRYCPVDVIGRCKATAKNHNRTWFVVNGTIPCPEGDYDNLLYYGHITSITADDNISYILERKVLYSDVLAIRPGNLILLYCPEGSPFYRQFYRVWRGHTYDQPDVPGGEFSIIDICINKSIFLYDHNAFFVDGTRLVEVKITANFQYENSKGDMVDAEALFEFEFVVFSNFSIVANATRLTRHHSNLSCELTISNASEFIITKPLWWTNAVTGEYIGDARETRPLPNSGPYQCHVELEHRLCEPYQKFNAVLSSNIVNVSQWQDSTSMAGLIHLEWPPIFCAISFLLAIQEIVFWNQKYRPPN